MKDNQSVQKFSNKSIMKFLIPSLLGIFIFLFPIPWNGSVNIPIGIISEWLAAAIKPVAPILITIFILISAIFSTITTLFKPNFILKNAILSKLFVSSNFYLIFKIIGAIVVVMVYAQKGPDFIISADTGGTMMSLLKTLIAWFFAASFLIPLLMDFGIMDFSGTLIRNFTQPLFKLPGRSAIDLLASWVGNCNVGVVLTTTQYEQGYYTGREAITIATCFSAVSLPFCLVIAAMLKVDHLFLQFYAILSITGVLSVVIMTRIPPLSKYSNEYYAPVGKQVNEIEPEGVTKFQWALQLGVERAKTAPSLTGILYKGIDMFLGIIFSLTPLVMSFGTIALILATYTPIFNYLSVPFGYYLQLLGLEEAFAAAPATIVGFVDMFIPAILAANLVSLKTRFVIGVLSLVQIIYMTEVGTLILTSKMPINFKGVLILFLQKTIISLPIIVLFTNLFGIA
jgi:nucleoside recognition membrane protein YjiH